MKRSTWRLAAVTAALVAVPTATAAGYETAGKPNTLHISVVSSPAAYVSGGDARVEIAVPGRDRARRRRGDAERSRRHLLLRGRLGGEPPARGRRDRPAARPEHARGEHAQAGEGKTALRRGDADEQPDAGPDLLRPAADAVRLRDRGQRGGDGPAADPARPPRARRRRSSPSSTGTSRTSTSHYDPAAPPPSVVDPSRRRRWTARRCR